MFDSFFVFVFSVGGDIFDKAKSKYITVQTTFIVSATKPTDRLQANA